MIAEFISCMFFISRTFYTCLENASASGGLHPADPLPGLCVWAPLGDFRTPGRFASPFRPILNTPLGNTVLYFRHVSQSLSLPVACISITAWTWIPHGAHIVAIPEVLPWRFRPCTRGNSAITGELRRESPSFIAGTHVTARSPAPVHIALNQLQPLIRFVSSRRSNVDVEKRLSTFSPVA